MAEVIYEQMYQLDSVLFGYWLWIPVWVLPVCLLIGYIIGLPSAYLILRAFGYRYYK